jgi:Uma2 family endonuclease
MVLLGGTVQVAPDTHLEPDLLVMPEFTQVPASWVGVTGHWLAVEVSGRSSRVYDRDYKRPAYLAAGVREFWRADLRDRCVYLATPEAPVERAEVDRLRWTPPDGTDVVDIDVPALFEGITDVRTLG